MYDPASFRSSSGRSVSPLPWNLVGWSGLVSLWNLSQTLRSGFIYFFQPDPLGHRWIGTKSLPGLNGIGPVVLPSLCAKMLLTGATAAVLSSPASCVCPLHWALCVSAGVFLVLKLRTNQDETPELWNLNVFNVKTTVEQIDGHVVFGAPLCPQLMHRATHDKPDWTS